MVKRKKPPRPWDRNDPDYSAQYPPPEGWVFPPATDWLLGHKVIMLNCYGRAPIEGKAIERTEGMVLIRTKHGELYWGSTLLLKPPTGEKWHGKESRVEPSKADKRKARRARRRLLVQGSRRSVSTRRDT